MNTTSSKDNSSRIHLFCLLSPTRTTTECSHNNSNHRTLMLHGLPTLDEWEQSLARSMSERPDEIFDIFERYAEEREEFLQSQAPAAKSQELVADEDDSNDNNDHDEDRSDSFSEEYAQEDDTVFSDEVIDPAPRKADLRQRWVKGGTEKESFMTKFIDQFRLNEVVARLTYPSMQLQSPVDGTLDKKSMNGKIVEDLRAKLAAAEQRARDLEWFNEECEQTQKQTVVELKQHVHRLEGQIKSLEQAKTKPLPQQQPKIPIASDFERFKTEMEQKVFEIALELTEETNKNERLRKELANSHASQRQSFEDFNMRMEDLELELEKEKEAHQALLHKCNKLDALVLQAENVLSMQRKKLERSQKSLEKMKTLYESEHFSRKSLEQLANTLKAVVKKLNKKVTTFQEADQGIFCKLNSELQQKDSMITAIRDIVGTDKLEKRTNYEPKSNQQSRQMPRTLSPISRRRRELVVVHRGRGDAC